MAAEQVVISRTDEGRWWWEASDGSTGEIVVAAGEPTWDSDPSGLSATVALVLRQYPEPPDRIVYEARLGEHRLDPPPPAG